MTGKFPRKPPAFTGHFSVYGPRLHLQSRRRGGFVHAPALFALATFGCGSVEKTAPFAPPMPAMQPEQTADSLPNTEAPEATHRPVPGPFQNPPNAKPLLVAVLVGDPSVRSSPGEIETVETFAESGISRATGVSPLSRRHLQAVMEEQGLAYSNAVHHRAKLGRLAGADILLLVSINENSISRTPRSVSAYGFTERTESVSSSAAISVKAIEVEGGRILASRVFEKQDPDGPHALDQCAALMESALEGFDPPASSAGRQGVRHKISVRPVSGGSEIPNLDLFIDGNFIGNTPIATDAEEGVRWISIKRKGENLWSQRMRIDKEVWLAPEVRREP